VDRARPRTTSGLPLSRNKFRLESSSRPSQILPQQIWAASHRLVIRSLEARKDALTKCPHRSESSQTLRGLQSKRLESKLEITRIRDCKDKSCRSYSSFGDQDLLQSNR